MKPSKEELEIEKLSLEIQEQKRTMKFGYAKLFIDAIQGLSIVVGIIFAINEFILKDREGRNQKTKITLEYLNDVSSSQIVTSLDSLKSFRDLTIRTPIPEDEADNSDSAVIQDERMREVIQERFAKSTFSLCHYYNILNQGIEKGYFDAELAYTFLAKDAKEAIDVLSDLQARVGEPGGKAVSPDYRNFKGLIEFYIQCYKMPESEWRRLPLYDIDKPVAPERGLEIH